MKQLTCEMCGSTDLVKQDGLFVCQSCGCKYSVEEAKKMMIEGEVTVRVNREEEVENTVKLIFKFIEEKNWGKAQEYCEKVFIMDAENPQAFLALAMIDMKVHRLSFALGLPERIKWYKNFSRNKNYLRAKAAANKRSDVVVLRAIEKVESGFWEQKGFVFYKDKGTGAVSLCYYKWTEDVVELPQNLSNGGRDYAIYNKAFEDVGYRIKTIKIPQAVFWIWPHAFDGCTSLVNFEVSEENTKFQAIDGSLYEKGRNGEKKLVKLVDGKKETLNKFEETFYSAYEKAKASLLSDYLHTRQAAFRTLIRCVSLIEDHFDINKEKENRQIIEKISADIIGIARSVYVHHKIKTIECFSGLGNEFVTSLRNIAVRIPNKKDRVFYYKYALKHAEFILENGSLAKPQIWKDIIMELHREIHAIDSTHSIPPRAPRAGKKQACYVATCVYGSYDCPQVWVLRRYRDNTLGSTWYGRAFIRAYYAISPTLVKWFGKTKWFKKMWKGKLDRMVKKLQDNGVADTPYKDKEW